MPLTADFAVHQRLDDFLTIQYSILGNHFHPSSGSEMLWALAKPMSFSYFLAAIRALGIPYNIALSLLWVLSAIVVVPEKLRTLDRGRPWRDSQFASTRLSPSRDMSR